MAVYMQSLVLQVQAKLTYCSQRYSKTDITIDQNLITYIYLITPESSFLSLEKHPFEKHFQGWSRGVPVSPQHRHGPGT